MSYIEVNSFKQFLSCFFGDSKNEEKTLILLDTAIKTKIVTINRRGKGALG